MNGRALSHLLPALLICHAADAGAAAVANGRNWRVSVDSIQCEAAGSVLVIGARLHYLGPRGPVEAPVSELLDGGGRPIRPRSLVLRDGDRRLAQWLASGGVANLQSEYVGAVQFKFDVQGAAGELKLAFGDLKSFALTRKSASAAMGVCESLLKPGQIVAPQRPRAAQGENRKLRVYREAYPCLAQAGSLRTIEADHPPQAPRQMLLFGRGYLPNARQVDLPMAKAPAQTYFYSGADDLGAVEEAARRAVAADFPEYRAGLAAAARKYFAFNWGGHKAQSGNDLYSVGIYDVLPCPR
jgi:hypothetical protein